MPVVCARHLLMHAGIAVSYFFLLTLQRRGLNDQESMLCPEVYVHMVFAGVLAGGRRRKVAVGGAPAHKTGAIFS